ncbi:family 20 glycosylhydrolase [Acidipila sp. 4G-K13]|uniref:Glycosyl hydrolase n=2 Tax=Paracidobacterium acidisoli TaxID=2303751 RepID=A0A372IJK8_9BACT|nr:family 20 glycosylhydrolase [Paracidobacterium acidisoli]MBT9333259.1 family 20 glycosylhydrolase [Paracidobacterium acidisoli]
MASAKTPVQNPASAQPSPSVFVNTLMPQPAHLTEQPGALVITPSFTTVEGHFHDARLDHAVTRALNRLKERTGLLIANLPADSASATLTVDVDGPGEAIQSDDENESYSLDVTPSGAHLHAATDIGAMHGLETLLQLVQPDGEQFILPAVSIQDAPRFRWRGLMIDCGRHFIPFPVLLRTLDAMAAVKMNVFHWHLTEDQGFRIESKLFPKLTEDGSDGLFYTQDQARELVAYARDRGIRVVPEFDMPGHTGSWLVGYPDLAGGPGPFHIERRFGVFDPVMDPTRDSTYKFIDAFIGEMAAIFPDPYMHIGGDENNGVEWKQNPRIQTFMHDHNLKDTAALQNYFNQKLLQILKKHDKRMVGWDEILTPDLPKDIVVQSWRGFDSLAAGAKQGYSGILSAGYYLDHMDSAEDHYLVDPIPAKSDLTADQQARILGGEACMWAEYVNGDVVDSRIWPRTAAIAERLWSPQGVNNVDDMYRRLAAESIRLESFGLTHLSQEKIGLRRLAGPSSEEAGDMNALRTFVSVLQPPDFSGIASEHRTTLSPFSALTFVLPPDPPSRHDFEHLVADYLQDPVAAEAGQTQLTGIFDAWIAAEPDLLRMMANSPILARTRPRAEQLARLGTLGSEAVSYLSSGQPAPQGWKARQLALLDQAGRLQCGVRFTVLQPLRDLVNSVQER